jgi:hypothetical protein
MDIVDLEHEITINVSETRKPSPINFITGAASAFVAGYAYAGPNGASAAVVAAASGQQTLTTANTLAMTSLYPYYGTSNSTASGYALGISPGSYASATLNASANSTSFNGNSSNMGSSITSSTYRSW